MPLLKNLSINLVSKKKKIQLEIKWVPTKEGIQDTTGMEEAQQALIRKQGYLWCSEEHHHGRGGHLPGMAVHD